MKNLKILIFAVAFLLALTSCGGGALLATSFSFENIDFSGCRVEVLEHAIYGGASLGELNAADTEYFVNIISSVKLGEEVENYIVADGECDKEYLIILANGDKIYFGQGYGESDDHPNGSFVHINGKVYTVKNPAELNGLYVVKERFMFYDRLSGVTQG